MKKLIALAQRRANNTGHAQYVVVTLLQTATKFLQTPRVQQHPDWTSARLVKEVLPQPEVRSDLRKRRKTRGGNRVRVGSNVR
jgi:hypothetical protein